MPLPPLLHAPLSELGTDKRLCGRAMKGPLTMLLLQRPGLQGNSLPECLWPSMQHSQHALLPLSSVPLHPRSIISAPSRLSCRSSDRKSVRMEMKMWVESRALRPRAFQRRVLFSARFCVFVQTLYVIRMRIQLALQNVRVFRSLI